MQEVLRQNAGGLETKRNPVLRQNAEVLRQNAGSLRNKTQQSLEAKRNHVLKLAESSLEIIVLSDSSDDSKKMSNKRTSITGKPVEGPPRKLLRCDEDTIQESQSPNYESKYLPVYKKHNPKVKCPIPITRCMLGLTNVQTWDDIYMKFGVRKVESGAAKAKRKGKV
uniref:Uncharacterized protein n=1 Tax=Tanacetum cinerariifolium TaxID=118510 RepID=A0A699IWT3_TANCI|nr:hypothetical protein [Tanacetum cinerariifolium]